MVAKESASRPDGTDTVRGRVLAALAGLPDVSYYHHPAFKVGKKFLCRIKDGDTLVVACPLEEKEMLLSAASAIYFETDHYRGWPIVFVRMAEVTDDELRHRLRRSWLSQAPGKLAKRLGAGD